MKIRSKAKEPDLFTPVPVDDKPVEPEQDAAEQLIAKRDKMIFKMSKQLKNTGKCQKMI